MGGAISIIALLGYLFLLIDWKSLRGVLAEGGFGAAIVYAIVAGLIINVLSHPAAISMAGGHHG